MITRDEPARMPEPPPAPASLADTLGAAAVIAGPALRLASIAAVLLLVALLYRVGDSADAHAVRIWAMALAGLVTLGLMELPHRRRRAFGAGEVIAVAPPRLDRAVVALARRWASIAVLLAMAGVAALVAAASAAPDASALVVACAIAGVVAARGLMLASTVLARSVRAPATSQRLLARRRARHR